MADTFTFSRKTTAIIKGIALILMFVHHLFGFPEWIVDGNYFISIPFREQSVAYVIGQFGNICVGMFMLLTGYGVYYSYKKGNAFSYSVKKIMILLVEFWIILFTFFVPMEIFFGNNEFLFSDLIQEMFGISNKIVSFAWYVRFYILSMLTLPLIRKSLEKSSLFGLVVMLVCYVICILLRVISASGDWGMAFVISEEYFKYFPIVVLGYLMASHGGFEKINDFLAKRRLNNIIFALVSVLVVFLLRVGLNGSSEYFSILDVVYVPIFIYALIVIITSVKAKALKNCIAFIGINSMNLWFLQSVFFGDTNKLQFIAYLPKLAPLCAVWSIFILLPFSLIYLKIFKEVLGK